MLQAVLGGLATSYLRGAATSFGTISSAARMGGDRPPNFNLLYAKMISETKSGLEIQDLKKLEAVLKDAAPELFLRFKREARKIGRPAANEIRRSFTRINAKGPLWNSRGPGRQNRTYDSMYSSQVSNISWYQTRFAAGRKGVDVNYKNRKASTDFSKLRAGSDGTIGIVRIAVKNPAYIMADITGRGNRRKATGQLSREYRIHAFGRGQYVLRRHKVNAESVGKWIQGLNGGQGSAGPASRYAYPTLFKHAPKFRENVANVLSTTITELNRRLSA